MKRKKKRSKAETKEVIPTVLARQARQIKREALMKARYDKYKGQYEMPCSNGLQEFLLASHEKKNFCVRFFSLTTSTKPLFIRVSVLSPGQLEDQLLLEYIFFIIRKSL